MSNHTPRGRQYLAHAIKGAAVAAPMMLGLACIGFLKRSKNRLP